MSPQQPILALDAYGTLFNLRSVNRVLEPMLGGQTNAFEGIWREKQVEFSFRRGLMRDYAPFSVCIADAFDYAAFRMDWQPKSEERTAAIEAYRALELYPDVLEGLERARQSGFQLWVLSNGHPDDLSALIAQSGIADHLDGVVSVDEIQSFKPNPEVYQHFLDRTGARKEEAWMVSGNTFDFIGAMSFGMRGVFVKRSEDVVFDPWQIEPDVVVSDLMGLGRAIRAAV